MKGGGNLRFFYGSERFSEGIDLDTFDIEPWAFQDRVDQTLASDLLKRTLGVLGSRIDYVNPQERSETKSKWVLGVRHPSESEPVYTQIEISHREYPYREFAKVESVPQAAVDRYAKNASRWQRGLIAMTSGTKASTRYLGCAVRVGRQIQAEVVRQCRPHLAPDSWIRDVLAATADLVGGHAHEIDRPDLVAEDHGILRLTRMAPRDRHFARVSGVAPGDRTDRSHA